MAVSSSLQKTPLHTRHTDLDARMMSFSGFDMPVQYDSIIEEHKAVREAAGLFDVSHMGEFLITGPDAAAIVQKLVTNDVESLYNGRAMYCVMCRPNGGIVDDLIVYQLAEDRFMLVVNAANIEKDWEWVTGQAFGDAELENISKLTSLLALQGPKSHVIMQEVLRNEGIDVVLDDLKFYHFTHLSDTTFLGAPSILSYTGYTGEKGLEVYCSAERAGEIWDLLIQAGTDSGMKPAGLGARDTLRLESGYCLYGQDISEETNPYEAGLGWIVKLDAGDFIGRDALVRIKKEGPQRKLVGFVMDERGIPRTGYPIQNPDGEDIGRVTSGTQSPLLKKGIGLGYVPNESIYTEPGSSLQIVSRGTELPATVHKPPFHKN